MDDQHSAADSDNFTWKALASIRSLATAPESFSGVDDAIAAMRERLFLIEVSESVRRLEQGRCRSTIRRLSRRSPRVAAVEDWLARTGQLDHKTILRIRRVKLLQALTNGKVVVRRQPLSEKAAALVCAAASFLVGMWMSWVWFAAEGNIELVCLSVILGSLLGSIAGRALDMSFRFSDARNKVLQLAPQLAEGALVA